MWDFLKWLISEALVEVANKLDMILANQQAVLSNQAELKGLVMGAKEDLATFAANVDEFGNACAAALAAIQTRIDGLNALIASGASAEEVKAAIDEVNAHLATVKTGLETMAAGGTTVVPEPPPVEPPPVEPL